MAVIHRTTLKPSKPELLAGWLPGMPWFRGAVRPEQAARAGGFRLDDPAGEVGLEFGVLTFGAADARTSWHLPMTYRSAPLPGGGPAPIGVAEHGVLGRRYVYDACEDPVAVAQLLALLAGRARAQAQGVSDTPDPAVEAVLTAPGQRLEVESFSVRHTSGATEIAVRTPAAPDSHRDLVLRVFRAVRPAAGEPEPGAIGAVSAPAVLPDGAGVLARYAVLLPAG